MSTTLLLSFQIKGAVMQHTHVMFSCTEDLFMHRKPLSCLCDVTNELDVD